MAIIREQAEIILLCTEHSPSFLQEQETFLQLSAVLFVVVFLQQTATWIVKSELGHRTWWSVSCVQPWLTGAPLISLLTSQSCNISHHESKYGYKQRDKHIFVTKHDSIYHRSKKAFIFLLQALQLHSLNVLSFSTHNFHLLWSCMQLVQFFIFSFFISFIISSSHLFFGLPSGHVKIGFHLYTLFTILSSGIRCKWPNQFNLCAFM